MIESSENLYRLFQDCSGVSTDSRNIKRDCLFIALKGPNFNANEFAAEAISKGAKYALVDEDGFESPDGIFRVKNGLEALQDLARHHRGVLKIPVIGITGSNGKTTTKELINRVLETRYCTFATQGNLNNHIGVPLTILSIGPEVEIAIVEMGANHVGEIAALSAIAQPSHGMITNIGSAHIEGFGGFEGVKKGKGELYQSLLENEGVVFVNSQDEILSGMAKPFKNPVRYPSPGDYLHITYIGSDPFLRFLGESNKQVETQLIGAYNFNNIAAALCIGKYFEVPTSLAEQAVASYSPQNNRSQILKRGSNTIILDAYNANPSSMRAALENLISMNSKRKVVVLGDMMELGDESESMHREIVAMTKDKFDQVFLCGSLMSHAKSSNPGAQHFEQKQGLIKYLEKNRLEQATVLVKASRSMKLEDILEVL